LALWLRLEQLRVKRVVQEGWVNRLAGVYVAVRKEIEVGVAAAVVVAGVRGGGGGREVAALGPEMRARRVSRYALEEGRVGEGRIRELLRLRGGEELWIEALACRGALGVEAGWVRMIEPKTRDGVLE
jgi:hypothetical protein